MKIALMTRFHNDNYGTVLQAAALLRVLKSYGHEVDIIDYAPTDNVMTLAGRSRRWMGVPGVIRSSRAARNPVITSEVSGEEFEAFRERNLTFTPHCETLTDLERLNELYDAFVCGSDRIWMAMSFDPRYFLDFVKDPERMIAYAPSILETENSDPTVIAQMKQLISRFNYLSVREENGRKYLDEVFVTKALELADPTLLIEPDDWGGALQLPSSADEYGGRYMLVMFRNPSRAYQDAAAKLAARLVLPQIIIPIHASDLKQENVIRDSVGPGQFVSLIRNAAYICTDSYHGTALALSFQKEFCCFERYTERELLPLNNRVRYILDAVGLRSRLYSPETSIEQYIRPIDYIPVNYKLDALKLKSREFLKDSLEKVGAAAAMRIPVPRHILQVYDLCSGCGACRTVCAQEAIRLEATQDGFYRAVVDEERCVRCEKCTEVCPFDGMEESTPLVSGRLLTYRDEDPLMRSGSSAGGAAGRLAVLLKRQGYAVAGCAMDEQSQTARHVLILPEEDEKNLDVLKGIKLMASDMTPLYARLAQEKDEHTYPLALFGTPCQIAGARKCLADRPDTVYIEIVCPGIPSSLLREKRFHSTIPGRSVQETLIQALQSGLFYNEACYSCRWRKRSVADIRIGDGTEDAMYRKSTLAVMTKAGTEVINNLMISGYWEGLHKLDLRGNVGLVAGDNPPMPVFYRQAFEKLRDEKTSMNRIMKDYVKQARTKPGIRL